jgi:ankyrin repeat protein
LENERLAAEAARQAEFERLERERLAAEEAKKRLEKETIEAIDLAMQVAADKTDFLSSDVRFAAGRLKNDLLAHYISVAPEMVEHSDKSGWRPIHEAARAGNLVGIQLLISAGCDLTSRTGRKGNGGTALWWAIQRFGEDHDAVKLLRYHGALDAGPAT